MDMSLAENLVRYNIDHSNINEDRIDWLLQYNKYHVSVVFLLKEARPRATFSLQSLKFVFVFLKPPLTGTNCDQGQFIEQNHPPRLQNKAGRDQKSEK